MVVNRKVTGKTMSMPAGLAAGAAVSQGETLLFAGVLAKLVDSERMAMENIGYGIMLLLLTASFLGALVSFGKIRRQRMLVCGVSGLIYFAMLLSITALFFGGQYSAVGVTALLVLAGSAAAALLGLRQNGGGKRKKMKLPHR